MITRSLCSDPVFLFEGWGMESVLDGRGPLRTGVLLQSGGFLHCCQPYTLLFPFMFLVVNLTFKIEPEVSGPQLIFRANELELRNLESRSDSGREGIVCEDYLQKLLSKAVVLITAVETYLLLANPIKVITLGGQSQVHFNKSAPSTTNPTPPIT